MIQQARRNGKSWFAEHFKNYCKACGKSLYICRGGLPADLFIDKDGVEHEVEKPSGLTLDAVFVEEMYHESAHW